jgi:hypothetical protein
MAARRWVPGQYAPNDLLMRIDALLTGVQERAKADRAAGRLKAAKDGEELVEAVAEHVRWASSTILSLEHAILMQCSAERAQ